MAGVLIENTGHLKEILRLLGAENWDCSWLITELECYDHCGWEGSEKWAGETLFLSNRDFLHDVELRDLQFVWGILSAIPASYTQEQVLSFPLPAFSEDENGERATIWRMNSVPSTRWPFWRSCPRTAPA